MASRSAIPETPNLAEGRNAAQVREALSSCRSFADVAALGVLFHGTCEEIEGDLQGGGYDGVVWTARTASVAQAYIPRSGITAWVHAPAEDERGDRIRPSQHIGFIMRWALDRANCTLEDLDVEWNGLSPYSWTIPEGWPTEGDLEDWLRGMGYAPDDRGVMKVFTSYGEDGQERVMPVDWSLPGQLIIALPREGFEIGAPNWSEDALGYATHNRVADFQDFGAAGVMAFEMEDALQSDYLGNVGHQAMGVLPAGVPKLDWLAIPAIHHDGQDHSVFQNPETPQFTAFMKSLNPDYRTKEELSMDEKTRDTPVKERLYAVMTDSHRLFDDSQLARMAPDRSRVSGFWTDDDPDAVWQMDRKTADELVAKLHHNSPRVVRAEKAVARIAAQREVRQEAHRRAREHVDSPFTETTPARPDETLDV